MTTSTQIRGAFSLQKNKKNIKGKYPNNDFDKVNIEKVNSSDDNKKIGKKQKNVLKSCYISKKGNNFTKSCKIDMKKKVITELMTTKMKKLR
jgi:hypothetical protein